MKLLQEFLWPLNWVATLILVALILSLKKRLKSLVGLLALSLLILIICSLPVFSSLFLKSVENVYPVQLTKDYPYADAIVVLGGTTAPVEEPRLEPEERDGSRLLPAVRLYKELKAPLILVSGGVPYLSSHNNERTESQDMKEILFLMGIPERSILAESRSKNTLENAQFSAEMLKARNVKSLLLVTSAFHMKRAVKLFENQGFTVYPVPTDHRQIAHLKFQHYLPKAGSLRDTTLVIKEHVAYLSLLLK